MFKKVPHNNSEFKNEMKKLGFNSDDAPYFIKPEWKKFPIAQATIKAMKKY